MASPPNKAIPPEPWYSLRRGTDPLFSPPAAFLRGVDLRHRALIGVYFLLFVGGYLSTHVYWFYPSKQFFCELFASPGAASVSVDLFFVGLAILLWIATDHRRMGFSIYTCILTIVYGLLVAIAVTVPLYLMLRTSRQAKLRSGRSEAPQPGRGLAFLLPFALYVGTMAYWHFGPTPFQEPTYCSPATTDRVR